jgi:hypothetical protein
MLNTASAPSLEVRFADFLDSWKARWRYEPRWPSGECGTGGSPQFRVWLPLLHPARKALGKAFFVEVNARSGGGAQGADDWPLYCIDAEETGPDGETVFLFRGPGGRVCLRAS